MAITSVKNSSKTEKIAQYRPLEEDIGNAAHLIILETDQEESLSYVEESDDPDCEETLKSDSRQFEQQKSSSKHKQFVSMNKSSDQERVFLYKGKSYCYSKHVFAEMLVDEASPHVDEEISLKTAMKEYKPRVLEYLGHTGKSPYSNGTFRMEEFLNYNGPVEGRRIVSLMKKWNYVLHLKEARGFAKNHSSLCSLGLVVAAILHVRGKRTDLPSYQSDLLHAKIRHGTTPGMWGLCMAVIAFHDKKLDTLSPSIIKSGATTTKRKRRRPSSLPISEHLPTPKQKRGRSCSLSNSEHLPKKNHKAGGVRGPGMSSATSPLQERPDKYSASRLPSIKECATSDHKVHALRQETHRYEESECSANASLGESSYRMGDAQQNSHHNPIHMITLGEDQEAPASSCKELALFKELPEYGKHEFGGKTYGGKASHGKEFVDVALELDQHYGPRLQSNCVKVWADPDVKARTGLADISIVSTKALEEFPAEIDVLEALSFVTGRLHRSTKKLHLKRSRGKEIQGDDGSWREKLRAEIKQVEDLMKVLANINRLSNMSKTLDLFLAVKKEKLSQLCSLSGSRATWEVTIERLGLLMSDFDMAAPVKKHVELLLSETNMVEPPKIPLEDLGIEKRI